MIPTGFVQLVDTGLFLVPPLPQPRVDGVFIQFFLSSGLCGIIKNNTLDKEDGIAEL